MQKGAYTKSGLCGRDKILEEQSFQGANNKCKFLPAPNDSEWKEVLSLLLLHPKYAFWFLTDVIWILSRGTTFKFLTRRRHDFEFSIQIRERPSRIFYLSLFFFFFFWLFDSLKIYYTHCLPARL